jgi:hypothetical protein
MLADVIMACWVYGAKLVIAKVDRLSRKSMRRGRLGRRQHCGQRATLIRSMAQPDVRMEQTLSRCL